MVQGRTWLIAILLVALVLRLLTAYVVQQKVGDQLCLIAGDAEGYWQLARKIAAGEEFSFADPPRRVHRMPGFPAVLALSMKLFGESPLAARCLLAMIGTAACGTVYLLGRQLFDERVGLIACGLTAVSPVMTGFSVLLLSETLFALTLTMSVWCAAKWLSADSRHPAADSPYAIVGPIITGVSIAIATHVRPSWLLAGPVLAFVAVWFCKPRRKTILEAAVMLLALFGALLPWAWRNHSVCGHWVFTTLWSGPSLYDGWNPDANGDSNMTFFDRDNLMASNSEWDVDQHYKSAAWQYASQHPGHAIELTVRKLLRYWMPWPNAKQFGGTGPALLVFGFFAPVCFLAARGWWLTRRRLWAWLLTLGPILYFAAIHAVFVGSLRYRLPAEYPLCVLSAVGLNDLFLRRRDQKTDG
ncbi:MAG: glycosyltransferase family 39 protein [Planctomycetes bacterium]|nr:glycosyltransferase family 39 protein [Planctomycetota bacterium]